MKLFWPISMLLTACGLPRGDSVPQVLESSELAGVAEAFALAQPDDWLALVEDLDLFLPVDQTCTGSHMDPTVHRLIWSNECSTGSSLLVDGELELFQTNEGAMVAGDRFFVSNQDEPDSAFYLDGAVELTLNGDLLIMDVGVSSCGGPVRACSGQDSAMDLTTVDLVYTLFPLTGFPVRYDLTVSGVVASADLEPATIHGAWSVDTDLCPLEPASGSAVIDTDRPHSLEFDGAAVCDSCASRTVDGQVTDSACMDWLL